MFLLFILFLPFINTILHMHCLFILLGTSLVSVFIRYKLALVLVGFLVTLRSVCAHPVSSVGRDAATASMRFKVNVLYPLKTQQVDCLFSSDGMELKVTPGKETSWGLSEVMKFKNRHAAVFQAFYGLLCQKDLKVTETQLCELPFCVWRSVRVTSRTRMAYMVQVSSAS